jgi:TPR repeat protein
MYMVGEGVEKSDELSSYWYRKAAENGNAIGQYNLGHHYRNGYGVPQDYGEAVKWLRMSAEQGNSDAQINLGWMYWHGRGVPKDYVEAEHWFKKAEVKSDLARRYLIQMNRERSPS